MQYKVIIVILPIIIISLAGCINQTNDKENESKNDQFKDKVCNYYYEIKINCSNSSYDLNVPLPVYSDEKRIIRTSKIAEDLKVVIGNSLFYIENTTYGPSLRIKGKNFTIINLSDDNLEKFLVNNNYSELFLSMAKDKDNDGYYDDEYGDMKYWIRNNQSDNIEIKINFEFFYGKPGVHLIDIIEIEGTINKSWNLIDGTFIGERM